MSIMIFCINLYIEYFQINDSSIYVMQKIIFVDHDFWENYIKEASLIFLIVNMNKNNFDWIDCFYCDILHFYLQKK